MNDDTEMIRRMGVAQNNSAIQTDDPAAERKRLEEKYGQVWDTNQLTIDFVVHSFAAPFAVVSKDGIKGTIEFQHRPRFYFNFQPI